MTGEREMTALTHLLAQVQSSHLIIVLAAL